MKKLLALPIGDVEEKMNPSMRTRVLLCLGLAAAGWSGCVPRVTVPAPPSANGSLLSRQSYFNQHRRVYHGIKFEYKIHCRRGKGDVVKLTTVAAEGFSYRRYRKTEAARACFKRRGRLYFRRKIAKTPDCMLLADGSCVHDFKDVSHVVGPHSKTMKLARSADSTRTLSIIIGFAGFGGSLVLGSPFVLISLAFSDADPGQKPVREGLQIAGIVVAGLGVGVTALLLWLSESLRADARRKAMAEFNFDLANRLKLPTDTVDAPPQ